MFTYDMIRDWILKNNDDEGGTVRYAMRRKYIAQLTFEIKSTCEAIPIDIAMNQRIMEISTRHARFESMSMDEKLAALDNLLEYMLKKNGNFVVLDYSKVCMDFVTDEMIKNYRKRLQCFRHASVESIDERCLFTTDQKEFLINYGIVLMNAINTLIQ